MKLTWLSLAASACAAIVGIDVGQQYTKAMVVAPGLSFEIVLTGEGKRKDWSAISLKPLVENGTVVDTERLYGSQIGLLCLRFPLQCVANVKPLLGALLSSEAAQEYLGRHPGVALVEDGNRSAVAFALGDDGARFGVEELLAMTLNEVKERVLTLLRGAPLAKAIAEDVAVSVAPYALQLTRSAYLDALQLANYSTVLGLVDEGTAVAVAYAIDAKYANYSETPEHHIVYDVGAGLTTATLFSFTPHANRSLGLDIELIGHDASFGGELLTQLMYELLYAKFLQQQQSTHIDLSPRAAVRLKEAAEKAKTILSANTETRVLIESFHNDEDFRAVVTREEFEAANDNAAALIHGPVLAALLRSPTGPKLVEDIKLVILNGGSTRVPFVQRHLAALLGEDKIAKTVNTDEACALGTTMRAYHLKTIRTNPYKLVLNDRVFSNFSVVVDGEEHMVFPAGSLASSTVKVPLGAAREVIKVELAENGEVFSLHLLQALDRKAALECEAPEVVGLFDLDVNKMFRLKLVTVRCDSEEVVLSTSLPGNIEINITNGASKRLAVFPVTQSSYTSTRPLSAAEKKVLSKRLAFLKQRDTEKAELDEKKNALEAACYNLRSLIEDHRQGLRLEVGDDTLDEWLAEIAEAVEWLEFGTPDMAALADKLASIAAHQEQVKKVMRMFNADLSMEGLRDLDREGHAIGGQVLEFLELYTGQIEQLRQEFLDDGFEFEKENNRSLRAAFGTEHDGIEELAAHYKEFMESLTRLRAVIDLPRKEFATKPLRDLYAVQDEVTNMIMTMMDDVLTLQTAHEKRIDFLVKKQNKLRDRAAQKEKKRAKLESSLSAEALKSESEALKDATEALESATETLKSATETPKSEAETPKSEAETVDDTQSVTAELLKTSTASPESTETGEAHDEL